MPHTLFLVPSGQSVGLTSVALGLVRALDRRGIRVAFYKPIGQHHHDAGPERSTYFVRKTTSLTPAEPISLDEAGRLVSSGRTDELFDRVMRGFHESLGGADVMIVEGLVDDQETTGENELNRELVRTLSAQVILVGALGDTPVAEFEARMEHTASLYGGFGSGHVIGSILNRVRRGDGARTSYVPGTPKPRNPIERADFNVIGVVPENPELMACRTSDIARHLGASIVHEGEMGRRRVKRISLLARTIPNLVGELTAGSLLVTPGDRTDVVIVTALAAMNKIPLAGLVLTGGLEVPLKVLELCRPALETGLPVLNVPGNSYETSAALASMSAEIPRDDLERAEKTMEFVAGHIDAEWIARHSAVPVEAQLSPAAFCFRLTERARALNRRIVLPEGDEPRTIRAAAICAERGIARTVLLAKPEEVRRVASAEDIELPPSVEMLDPGSVRARYVAPLVELRKHKGLTPQAAADLLEDNVWLGTMMLAQGEVDGLVSGAVHSTANTIRPALQIIKTKPGAKVVSSIFFMRLPEQVVVYGDCAVIPDPDAETLADIAIQSADSATRFGLPARVAMISYSTGESGSGLDVDKVREATKLACSLRPDLALDGPLQYDAAMIPSVAKSKAPKSPVAGKATVFVFPDLNTGNTTYKAVQRSAHVISIGPMLQGLRRPVNDLSRGALVEDIVYTIALTAIQAGESRQQLQMWQARAPMPHRPASKRLLRLAGSFSSLVVALLVGSCSSTPSASAPSGSAPASADSQAANATPSDAQQQGLASVFVVHLMSDYDAFKEYFEEGAAERSKNGVKGYLLSKIDDGRVVIHFFADDIETVDKALKSPEMQKYLERKGAPETSVVWLTRDVVVKLPATPPTSETYSLYLKVKVADFDVFQRAFEERLPVYAEQGVIAEGLHQSTEKDEIAILHFMGTSKEKLEALPKRKEFGELLALTKNPSEAKPLIGVDVSRSRPE